MKKTIMLVEDERAVRELVVYILDSAGFTVIEAAKTSDAMALLAHHLPDLILLDWMLPGSSGVEFTRRLKRMEQYQTIPIILLTARGSEEDKVRGLNAGADDYITKPFSTRELIARVRAMLRRLSPQQTQNTLKHFDLILDKATHQVTINHQKLEIGPTEFRLLAFFLSHPQRVFSRTQLLDNVWGSNVFIEERTVDVHIRRLRKLLMPTDYAKYIQTVRGAGYRLSDAH